MLALAIQRLVLRSAATPLRRLWPPLYQVATRLGAALLARGVRGGAVYVRGGAAGGELLPGMSDVDLALVVPAGAERARRRWEALRARVPGLDRVLDWPLIFDRDDLTGLAGSCALTYGLGDGCDRAAYFGERPTLDWIRILERPRLQGPTADWRLLRGPDLRPVGVHRDAQAERLAAWLEVHYWWRWAFLFCDQPRTPRTADLCVKLVAEPASAWLWLAHREVATGRADALARMARRLPEETAVADLALGLQRRLPWAPPAPLEQVLPALVRFTRRIDECIQGEIAGAGVTAVRLAGAAPEAGRLPLGDWPALAAPAAFAESFEPTPGDPGDPAALAAAVRAHRPGRYRALRTGDLLVLPAAPLPRTRMRAVKSRASDPVSFALVGGEAVARFPRVRGWSAEDVARRAVAEHRAWLRTRRAPPVPWIAPPPPNHPLGMLLSAGRAALFARSVGDGEPELVLGPAEIGRRLGRAGEAAVEAHAASAASGEPPPAAVVGALEAVLLTLPAYA